MSRVLCWAFLMLLGLPLLHGQGKGVVEGRLVNGTDPKAGGMEAEIDAIGMASGMDVLKSTKADKSGRFRFEGIPTDSPVMLRADYKSVSYFHPIKFDSSGKVSAEITIFEPTSAMNRIRVESDRLALQLNGDRLRSLEEMAFKNETNPPRSYMKSEGSFRVLKSPDLMEVPRLQVTGPGSAMPLKDSALESADGTYYYSLYPLRPGTTTFEVDQSFPYKDRGFVYKKRFYYDVDSFQVGVVPQDMVVSGDGLQKVQSDSQRNFAIYVGGPTKAGTEVVWTITGGTPIVEPSSTSQASNSKVSPMPTILVGQNALVLGPLILMGLTAILWYAYSRTALGAASSRSPEIKGLKARRLQLLDFLARLDDRFENHGLERRPYLSRREQGKRQLRRVMFLLRNTEPDARYRESRKER